MLTMNYGKIITRLLKEDIIHAVGTLQTTYVNFLFLSMLNSNIQNIQFPKNQIHYTHDYFQPVAIEITGVHGKSTAHF